jgi:hypothetical protein
MRLASNVAPVERFGVVEAEADFRIKPTPKAFQILTSKLYKDKIAAIIRELSCNAYDSHVEAGKAEEPFLVHLPTALEPELVIRDYGTGLSDTDVRTIFTTFFESTKENTNEQIGALGLGCKSPFSYTDTYTVKSFWNGKVSTYVCFIENALPKIRRTSRLDTTEPNGLEVSITVKPGDYHAFQSKAVKIFKWFPHKPQVTGGHFYTHASNDSPVRSGDGWYLLNERDVASKAIMGNVAYPIDKGVMESHFTDFEKRLLTSFVFYFGIGELDVQAGREELSYDTATIRAIKKRIKRVSKELSTLIQTEFKECTTFVEASRKYLEKGSTVDLFNLVPPRWNGQIITGGVMPPVEGELYVRRHTRLKFEYPRHRRRGGNGRTVEETSVIEPWSDVTIFIDDLQRGGMTRFKKVSADSTYPCYLFQPGDGVSAQDALTAFKDFERVRLTSSISVERRTAKVRQFSYTQCPSHYTYLGHDHRREVEVDIEEGGIYITTRSGDTQGPRQSDMHLQDLLVWFRLFYSVPENAGRPIYLVPMTMKKRFETGDGWRTLYDAVHEQLQVKLADPAFMHQAHALWDRNNFNLTLFSRTNQIVEKLPKRHPLSRFMERYNEKVSDEVAAWYPLLIKLDAPLNSPLSVNWPPDAKPRRIFDPKKMKLKTLWSGLNNMPLLKAVVSSADIASEAIDDLAQYAKLKLATSNSSR